MKLSVRAAILSTFKFVVLLLTISQQPTSTAGINTSFSAHLTHSPKGTNEVNQTKDFWPWNHNSCFPFWPFRCSPDQAPPSPISASPPPLPRPPTPASVSPIIPTPALPPLTPLVNLVFADQRLAAVYLVIQKFRNIITSDPLGITKTWAGSDICSYKGFFCDIPPDNASATAVAAIDFNGYGLTAPSIDGFIDQLPDLAIFHANSNNFGGIVSPNIAKLKYLYELDISNNKFSGTFPLAVVGMDSLTFLDVRFNLFFGSVPPAIFAQNLEVLFLNDNNFVSTLPDNLGSTHILYLTLANNKFTGPIPRDIAKALGSLTEVLLFNNDLTGCLPYELGFLSQVTVFDISSNQLTGPLPFSLACMERVQLMDFSGNLLYGMVPDLICQLPNLVSLTLSNNFFIQVGPFCRKLISEGVLDVRNNCIPGLPFQRSVIECAAFFALPRICPYMDTYKLIPCKPRFPW